LIPIGQLDGGHVLYALLRTKAHFVAQLVLLGAIVGVILTGNWGWSLMLMLLLYMGPNHPPTANDDMPLGTGRTVLGWLTLLFIIIGFTPQPFL
jgi:membrane-associated protease RseP (regulator of RpoE activity)